MLCLRVVFGLTVFALVAPEVAWCQDAAKQFDVASVKAAAPQARGEISMRGGPGSNEPGRITYTNVSLKLVLENAYNVQEDQISGPSWLESARYDILATMPAETTKEQFREMLQSLVKQRFKLGFHLEKKDFAVYELVVAKNGPKFKAGAKAVAETVTRSTDARGGLVDAEGYPQAQLHQTAQKPTNGVAKLTGNQITMATLANFLKFPMTFLTGGAPAGQLTTRVVDKTGLSGEYDVKLAYDWPGTKNAADPADVAPSIFTALQEQLGLKLEQTKQSLDVLVVERAEKTPTEN